MLRGQDTGRALGATRPEMEESHTARDAREREREAKEGWAFFPTSLKMFSILRTVLHGAEDHCELCCYAFENNLIQLAKARTLQFSNSQYYCQ